MFPPVIEIATCYVKPELVQPFEASMATLREIFSKAIGNRGFSLLKCEGEPATYKMLVEWETIADHRDRFRASREFNEMGELLSKYFDRPAELHYTYRVFDARA